MGLPDSSQPITKVIVGVMMAIRWLEAHVMENNRQEAPTKEQLEELDCIKDLSFFETMCKILNFPMEVKKIWAKRRLMPRVQSQHDCIIVRVCEAPVLSMPNEKGMYVLDTDASVIAISGILNQEQEWNGTTVLRPIDYSSKVFSNTEMKYGAPKTEIFSVITFLEKYRAYFESAPFKLLKLLSRDF